MEECELCGKPTNEIFVVVVEDVELRVCAKDAKGKKIVSQPTSTRKAQKRSVQAKRAEDEVLVDNYGSVIRETRERMQIPIKVLAEMLNEKETLLSRVEQQQTMPSIALTKKLEKALGIKLVAQENDEKERVYVSKSENPTLGDFVDSSKEQ